MAGAGMVQMQLYVSEQLKARLLREFGEGRVSANVERILRSHVENPVEDKKLRFAELNKAVRAFNFEFGMSLELMAGEEKPPMPPKENCCDFTRNPNTRWLVHTPDCKKYGNDRGEEKPPTPPKEGD